MIHISRRVYVCYALSESIWNLNLFSDMKSHSIYMKAHEYPFDLIAYQYIDLIEFSIFRCDFA